MRMVKKAAYLAWLLLAGALFGMIMAGCQNNDSSPEDSNIEADDEFFGEYVDDELGIVYVLNGNGTYSIKQGDHLLESGTLELSDDNSRRAIRKGKKNITNKAKKSGGAKGSTKKPSASKSSVTKSSSGNTNIGNTPFSKKGTSSSSKKTNQVIYVQSEWYGNNSKKNVVPVVRYYDNADPYSTKQIVSGSPTGTIRYSGSTKYKWYKFTIKKSEKISGHVYRNDKYFAYISTTSERVISIDANGNLSYSKPAGVRSASTEESEYNGNDYLWYVQGNFTADSSEQWEALNGYNNMKEIAEGVFQATLYLPKNIYGFKIMTRDDTHDYSMALDYQGLVPKNEWFEVVESWSHDWYSKNAAISTGGGLYTFTLDLSDETPMLCISTDEEEDSSEDDANLYVVGNFDDINWKFTDEGVMEQTSGTITKFKTKNPIKVSKEGQYEFKIADKAWGGIFDEYWYNENNEDLLGNDVVIKSTYKIKKWSYNTNITQYLEAGEYDFYLDIYKNTIRIEKVDSSTTNNSSTAETRKTYNLTGNYTENLIDTYNVEAGKFYMCEITGNSDSSVDIWTSLKTQAKDSIGSVKITGTNFSEKTYCYAYTSGKASMYLKSANDKTITARIKFTEIKTPSDFIYGISYNDATKWDEFYNPSKEIEECSYTLGADGGKFYGEIYNSTHNFTLRSNSIATPLPEGITVSEDSENPEKIYIINNNTKNINLKFSMNNSLKVVLTAEEIKNPIFDGKWYYFELDTNTFTGNELGLVINNYTDSDDASGKQTSDITGISKNGLFYFDWKSDSEIYYISNRADKPSASAENGKLKIFVYSDSEKPLKVCYWCTSWADSEKNIWPGDKMTLISK